MIEWIALVLFLFVVALSLKETFVDTEFTSSTAGSAKFGVGSAGVATSVQRPPEDTKSPVYAVWKSKIDAQVPIGANDDDYMKAIRAFYDKVYEPATTKPTTAAIEQFLASSDVTGTPIDPSALRIILADGFHIQGGKTAAAKELEQVKFTPSKALEPGDARDEVYTRTEEDYRPADTRKGGPVPEGYYAPLKQQQKPRRLGEANYETVGKSGVLFYDVCAETNSPGCTENVL
jgi:hypothetical protein